jgi:carbamoyltransferase
MKILGISAFYHDSAASLIINGEIISAAQEERFTRIKQDASFPHNAIKFCLDYSNLNFDDLDAVVFYDKPFLKFERLLETYYAFSPKGISSFITAIPIWIKEKLFFKRMIYSSLKKIQDYDEKKLKILFPEHHLSHAASAFYPSPFDESAIVTLDGVGEWATASICLGKGNKIKILKQLEFPHSIGLLYSAFTYFLGFKVNSGEYKLMGLAPYGISNSDRVKKFIDIIKNNLVIINDDGSIWLNQKYFNYAAGLRMVHDKKWEKLFGIPKRESETEFEQIHCDLGFAIQSVTEEIVLKIVKHAKQITGSDNLCLSGGVALNCVANGKIESENIFNDIYIQPAAGDAGGALGAALTGHYIYFEKPRKIDLSKLDSMSGSYLGPEYNNCEIENVINKYNALSRYYDDDDLYREIANHIVNGNAVGWMQGRMEFGPRALGNRSILADPTNSEIQKKLNLKIKYRESFRPFAPSVLIENVNEYFETNKKSPYMLLVHPVTNNIRNKISEKYHYLDMRNKLYTQRSKIPAITHVDFSARVQTVHKETNIKYWKLINEVKNINKIPIVVNTSFNVRGEPIVCTPNDAYRCFMRTEMDYLVIGNYVFNKKDQPLWENKDNWKEEFKLD